MSYYLFFFFFSSRRRHTRLVSDWSSDVCSSDLKCPRLLHLSREAGSRLIAAAPVSTGSLREPSGSQTLFPAWSLSPTEGSPHFHNRSVAATPPRPAQ